MSKTCKKCKVSWGSGMTLTVIFGILKLTGFINWSWWWVFSPILFSLGLVILVTIVGLISLCGLILLAALITYDGGKKL